ncbi:unnamed protein product [Chrysoparadoxa australica]
MIDIPLTHVLVDDSSTTLEQLRGDRELVLDLWTTKCIRCPAALDKMNTVASRPGTEDVVFVSCNLDDLKGAKAKVEEHGWQELQHVFAESEAKGRLLVALGLKSVPFYVVLGKDGVIKQMGGPKNVDLNSIFPEKGRSPAGADSVEEAMEEMVIAAKTGLGSEQPPAVPAQAPIGGNFFTLDEDF